MDTSSSPATSLIEFLCCPTSYGVTDAPVTHIETHASHLFLVGAFAYKLKKSLHLDFIDSRSPLRRRQFCEDEVSLNGRFAPGLYEGVIGVGLDDAGAFILREPDDQCVDFLVKMKRFNEHDLLESMLRTNPPPPDSLARFATTVATIHQQEPPCTDHPAHRVLERYISSNADQLRTADHGDRIARLVSRQLAACAVHDSLMAQRCCTHVKKLHGDLHTRNICLFRGELVAFDGIEFNADLNTIDTMSDLSFLLMDLIYLGAHEALSIIISTYLRLTGDYQGLALLPLLISYRAAIRAKITFLGASAWNEQVEAYVSLAERAIARHSPILYAVGGLSGSGKSTIAGLIAQSIGGVLLRSDYVRKELFGGSIGEPAPAAAYLPTATHEVYRSLLTRAAAAMASGLPIVVDATFLNPEHQSLIRALGDLEGACTIFLWCDCSQTVALERIRRRSDDPSDATAEVRALQEKSGFPPPVDWTWLSTEGELDEVKRALVLQGIFRQSELIA